MANNPEIGWNDVPIMTPLFDRFESDDPANMSTLADDVTDILGARKVVPQRVPGVLNWGLPDVSGLSPSSQKDREHIAAALRDVLMQFEPRLAQVTVTPMEGRTDFTCIINAQMVQPEDRSVILRVLSPLQGGGLSAEVVVLKD